MYKTYFICYKKNRLISWQWRYISSSGDRLFFMQIFICLGQSSYFDVSLLGMYSIRRMRISSSCFMLFESSDIVLVFLVLYTIYTRMYTMFLLTLLFVASTLASTSSYSYPETPCPPLFLAAMYILQVSTLHSMHYVPLACPLPSSDCQSVTQTHFDIPTHPDSCLSYITNE